MGESILRRPVVITMLIIFFYTFLFSETTESEQMEPNGPSSSSIHCSIYFMGGIPLKFFIVVAY